MLASHQMERRAGNSCTGLRAGRIAVGAFTPWCGTEAASRRLSEVTVRPCSVFRIGASGFSLFPTRPTTGRASFYRQNARRSRSSIRSGITSPPARADWGPTLEKYLNETEKGSKKECCCRACRACHKKRQELLRSDQCLQGLNAKGRRLGIPRAKIPDRSVPYDPIWSRVRGDPRITRLAFRLTF